MFSALNLRLIFAAAAAIQMIVVPCAARSETSSRRAFRPRGINAPFRLPFPFSGVLPVDASDCEGKLCSADPPSRRKRRRAPVLSSAATPSSAETEESEGRSELSPVTATLVYTVTGVIDMGVSTSFAYLSSFVTGYVFSGALGLRGGISGLNSRAMVGGKQWGELGAAFTGFGSAVKFIQGGRTNRYSNLCSSCCAGAYLSRKNGPKSMASGCLTYAGITYLFENMGGAGGGGRGGDSDSTEFDFQDRAVQR